eukprot:gnl/TRDRNA2_/TRDRNA2_149710_c0_seq1.p1 gnl/TRDRNA2_/TRDRNA2_149710_c0~~gnl/TRDRNA2_/TRDRNA2_149710_c0_seq1.p1  ORF type:complete len:283 (+),score=32.73 gnl/TRDRNA2_/TRDRNA2_149710_c0_seq1:86-850(+)
MYAGLLDRFCGSSISNEGGALTTTGCSVGRAEINGPVLAGSKAFLEQVSYVSANIGSMLQRCRVLRPIPSEAQHTNGINRGASLEFLIQKGFYNHLSSLSSPDRVGVNPMASITLRENGEKLIVQIYAQSSLSKTTYMWFSLYATGNLLGLMNHLIYAGEVKLVDLFASSAEKAEAKKLIGILLHANLLYYLNTSEHDDCHEVVKKMVPSETSEQPSAKERRPKKRGSVANRTAVLVKQYWLNYRPSEHNRVFT